MKKYSAIKALSVAEWNVGNSKSSVSYDRLAANKKLQFWL